jgi:DNA repair photolyase
MNSPTLNEDGWSVKGCSIIYAPRGQAGEYAKLATNPYRGCGHKCAYCYVPKVLRMTRPEFDAGANERPNFLQLLIKDAKKYQVLGITEQVMLSFTTDPYHPFDTALTRDVILQLQAHGLGVCTLTKGGDKALRDLELFRPDRDAFASTLTSLDNDFSQKWERGAASPFSRIATLERFHNAGIFTWVSLEPTLDTASSLAIIERTHEFVDLYKIGRANYLPMTYTTDWEAYTGAILELVNRLGVKHYIKKDLQKYLPKGYDNPKYIDQFHPYKAPQPEIVKIENGYYEVRVGSRVISYHSSQWGAEQVAQKIASKTYEPPRLATYGDLRELQGRGLG